ncbi:MAG: DUF2442 domain-containing protein [Oscillospiraceae bacterium]|nr:DUF2442 domain-containing protein [Oscillospiraceae bacterium]
MHRPKLYQVLPTENHMVYLFYDNGEVKLYDCRWVLEESGIFAKIHDITIFKELCTIMNGTLAFDISYTRDPYSCIDICPDTIYEESAKCSADILSLSVKNGVYGS